MTKDILLVDKPAGISSFDVIRILRRKTGIRKMGHAGTLDPMASGLMIIGIKGGTKKLKNYIKLDKTYETEILLGKKTTTGDLEGEILEEISISCKDLQIGKIKDVLKSMVGDLKLPVPKYSAIKVDGKRLYKYARENKDVKIPIKDMTILKISFLNVKEIDKGCVLSLILDVSSGTYIRSIAEEIGNRLGFPATVFNLRRTRIGQFYLSDVDYTL